jgi:hypothetical protein
MATYDYVCLLIFLYHFWVTLPRAPHLLICAETNGGTLIEKLRTIVEKILPVFYHHVVVMRQRKGCLDL